MSSNGEDIIRETFEKFGDAIGVQMQIPDAMIANLGAVLQAQIDLLAELQSAGRLVPTGGMALTAERLAELIKHAPAPNDGDYNDGYVAALTDLRDALFPATEPAEEAVGDPLQAWKEFLKPKPIGWYRTMTPQFATEHFGFPGVIGSKGFWTHTASDGGKWAWDGDDWELREYPPAPADPAEEATKAERRDPDELAKRMALIWEGGWDEFDEKERDYLRCAAEIARAYYASSPVVPAPTETGPWKHRVNGEICVASPASGLPYTIGKFNDHGDFVWHSSSAELPEGFAPFVAAEEG